MYTSFSQSTATAEGCRRVQAASMGGGSSGDSKTAAARILGSGSAGVFELVRCFLVASMPCSCDLKSYFRF
jgi:hypothetical protein